MRIVPYLCTVLLLSAFPTPCMVVGAPPTRQPYPPTLDILVPKLMKELHVPGVSIVGIKNRQIAWQRQYGVRSASAAQKVDQDTVFEACSMSKLPAAYIALKLVEQGKLDLDKPLVEYLDKPYLKDEPLHKKITARMVLTHTSGFPNWRKGGWRNGGPLPVLFEPGTKFGYSGEGFLYLQRVIEHITGQPWELYAKKQLLDPLGLTLSSYVWEDRFEKLAAAGHDRDGKVKSNRRLFRRANAAYSLYCTPREYAKLIIEIMQRDRSAPHSLSAASIQTMLTPAVEATGRQPIKRPAQLISNVVYRGLGWAIDKTVHGNRIYHSGSNGTGFRCYCEFDYEAGSGFVIMTNSVNGRQLWERIVAAVPLLDVPKIHRITQPEYEATLQYWAKQHPQILHVEQAGKSVAGEPIYLLRITDPSAPNDDKQIALITALHGGPERSGTTTILHLAQWLLGNSSAARETRLHQLVLLMPILNPYAFFVTDRFGNANHIDPYTGGGAANWDFKTMTYKKLDKVPEIKAFLDVVDRYAPDVHVDMHGTGLQEYPVDKLGDRCRYRGQTMGEVTGSAYSNYTLRPWDWRVNEAMISAGLKAGYPSDRFEADAQRLFWGPAMQPIAGWLWLGRPNFYTAQYAYVRYHTMLAALEVGWEQSGVARLRGLLDIGNSHWQNNPVVGYPVNRVKSFIGHYVCAWGTTASERRRSRIELWQRQPAFAQAIIYPQTDGRDSYIVATNSTAAKRLDLDLEKFLNNLRAVAKVRADSIAAFLHAGPEIKLAIASAQPAAKTAPTGNIQNGLALQLRIPYQHPTLSSVCLNGQQLELDPRDGYQVWLSNGYTIVQINVPPVKSRATDLYVVTCSYVPDVQRSYGWQPPPEVMRQLQEKQSSGEPNKSQQRRQ